MKKQNKPKSTTAAQPSFNTCCNPISSVAKHQQSTNGKNRSLSGTAVNSFNSTKNKSGSFSAKKTQTTVAPTAKKSKGTPGKSSKVRKTDSSKAEKMSIEPKLGNVPLFRP